MLLVQVALRPHLLVMQGDVHYWLTLLRELPGGILRRVAPVFASLGNAAGNSLACQGEVTSVSQRTIMVVNRVAVVAEIGAAAVSVAEGGSPVVGLVCSHILF